jgi:hypothetical protein
MELPIEAIIKLCIMKKLNPAKLQLNKEKIANLTQEEMNNANGGAVITATCQPLPTKNDPKCAATTSSWNSSCHYN